MKYVVNVLLVLACATGASLADPILDITPDPLKFGHISVGGLQQRNLVLVNVGDQSLTLDSCQWQWPFNVDPVAGMVLAPGDTTVVVARFAPGAIQPYSGNILFFYGVWQYTLNVTANGVRSFAPGEIIWSFQHIENVVCVTATDDIDGDGLADVAAEGYDSGAQGDPLVCLSGSGDGDPQVIWSVHPAGGPSNSGGYGDQCLMAGSDYDGDGYGDLLRGTAWGGRTVYVISGLTGEIVWSYDTYQHLPSGWVYAVREYDDLNGDGIPEVVAAAGSDADRVYCFSGFDGELIWQYVADDGVATVTVLPDINEDGFDEAVFAATDYGRFVYCISGASQGNGTPLWMFNMGQSTWSITTIRDINNDLYDDVLVGTWGRGIVAFSGHRFGQGVILWETPVNTNVMKVVACSDLNGDDIDDLLVASWSSYALAFSGSDGAEIWRFYCGDDVWAMDYIEDQTGDGVPEVIAGSFTHDVYLINGATHDLIWQTGVGAKPFSVRPIGDVNGDGFADVIVGTQMLSGAGGKVFVLSGKEVPTSIDEPVGDVPRGFIVTANYPNPFNSSTIINFSLEGPSPYEIMIYDIAGRLVDRLEGAGKSGENGVTWAVDNKAGLATGVYFYRIKAGDKIGAGKMMFLK